MTFNPGDGVIDTPGTVNEIPEYDEGKYVEYKDHLIYSEEYDENHTEETWYNKLRHEMVAFANAEGGMMVFGVSDDSEEGVCVVVMNMMNMEMKLISLNESTSWLVILNHLFL